MNVPIAVSALERFMPVVRAFVDCERPGDCKRLATPREVADIRFYQRAAFKNIYEGVER